MANTSAIDVADGSVDATATLPACSEYEMLCGDGACIDILLKCDGHFDCADHSDELNCESTSLSFAPFIIFLHSLLHNTRMLLPYRCHCDQKCRVI